MTLARVLDVCDRVAAAIAAAWNPSAPDAVQRAYAPDLGFADDQPDTLVRGRQVYVFPAEYAAPEMADRASLWRKHRVAVLVVERFTETGPTVPNDWLDERVAFVEQVVFNPLRNPTLVLTGAVVAEAYPALDEAATVDPVYDLDLLIQQKAFWSQVTLPFQELTDLTGA